MPALGTDYQNAKPMDDFSPIPVGDYRAVITESEVCETKAQDGQYLKLRVEVIEGEYRGRLIFVNLNLWNKNPKAVEIANRELASIVAAVGCPGAQNSEDLHNIPMIVRVGVEPGSGSYGPQNKIKNYLPITTVGAPPAIPPKAAPEAAAAYGKQATPPINPATGLPYKPWETWPGKGQ